jgi:hypothetical protein
MPVRNLTVIALQHQTATRPFDAGERGPGGPMHRHVFVRDLAVPEDPKEPGVVRLAAGGVEPRRTEEDVEALPLARRAAGVDQGRGAVHIPAVHAPGVDPGTGAVSQLRGAPAVRTWIS